MGMIPGIPGGNAVEIDAVGIIETNSFPLAVAATDAMVKGGRVVLTNYHGNSGRISCVVRGDRAEVVTSVDAGIEVSGRADGNIELLAHRIIPRPHQNVSDLFPIAHTEKTQEFTSFSADSVSNDAIGMVETNGLSCALAAADAMVKAATVRLVGYHENLDRITVIVRGELSEVKVSASAGVEAGKKVFGGVVHSVIVVSRPHNNVSVVFPVD
ncbi:MAG: BMC domain-containing protein [Chloroflexota bacterium]